jgi:hypothetical protein
MVKRTGVLQFFFYEKMMSTLYKTGGCRGRDHMVYGFTTTCAISAYHRESCEFEPRS